MRIDRFDYTVWIVCLLLIVAIAGLVWSGQQKGVTITATNPAPDGEVGAKGPIVIRFPQPIISDSVQGLFTLEPDIPGNISVRDDELIFFPLLAFDSGEEYTATLKAGTVVQDGRLVKKDHSWSFSVRQPWIIYLGSEDNELYRQSISGGNSEQLTELGSLIFDFAPSNDGNQIAYTVVNQEKGIDVWVIDRDGNNQRMLINCGTDRCSAIDWSPDGNQIAYSRIEASQLLEDPYSAPRTWLADTSTGETMRLYADSQKMGYGPDWSPTGTKLTYSDGSNSRLVVLDMISGDELFIPNQSGRIGSWSPDGNRLVFSDFLITESGASEVVYLVDFGTEDIINLFGHRPNESSYSGPVWSPTGEWIMANAKVSQTDIQYQLMLMAADASYGFILADEPDYAYLNYSFDATGNAVAYQRTQLGVAYSVPEVLVIDLQSKEILLAISGATFPAWLP